MWRGKYWKRYENDSEDGKQFIRFRGENSVFKIIQISVDDAILFLWGIPCRNHFRSGDHLPSNLGTICGPGIIWGPAQYSRFGLPLARWAIYLIGRKLSHWCGPSLLSWVYGIPFMGHKLQFTWRSYGFLRRWPAYFVWLSRRTPRYPDRRCRRFWRFGRGYKRDFTRKVRHNLKAFYFSWSSRDSASFYWC